jgi:hypothetical protein
MKVGEKTPTQLGPLKGANLNHWFKRLALSKGPNLMSSPPPSPVDGNKFSFRNVMFSRIPDDGKSKKNKQ